MDEFFTEKEVARMLKIRPSTLARWRCESKGPPFTKFGNRAIRYARADLDKYLKRQRVEPIEHPI